MARSGASDSATLEAFFAACAAGDVEALRKLLRDPDLAGARDDEGVTGLHLAVRHPDAVRVLLEHGADPNARDVGDNALPLHLAAGGGHLESARALLDRGSDVHGVGDLHRLEVIGWATVFRETHREVADLLLERGARHHVFSAIALADLELIRSVVEDDPEALARRLSTFEQEQTALHYVIAPPDGLTCGQFRTGEHYAMLDLLIELGADLDVHDTQGRTPLAIAMLRGDREAMRRLHAAGAAVPGPPEPAPPEPERPERPEHAEPAASLTESIHELTPMLRTRDMTATVAWYREIGFELAGCHEEGGTLYWALVRFGDAEIMLVPSHEATEGVSLWIRTDRLDDLYAMLRERQLEHARATLAGETTGAPELPFATDLNTAFYGQREFAIRDPNGVELYFFQPVE